MKAEAPLLGNGFAVSRDLSPKLVNLDSLKPLGRQTRKHPPAQIRKLQSSIEQFGFVLPIVIDAEGRVVAGWGWSWPREKSGPAPSSRGGHQTISTKRSFGCCGSRSTALAKSSSWDFDALTLEFSDILEIDLDADLQISGFEMGEIDVAFARAAGDEEDELPALDETAPPITKLGDLWLLGEHRLLCGDALARRQLRAPSRRRAGADGLHRSALEHSYRGQCLGARRGQTR